MILSLIIELVFILSGFAPLALFIYFIRAVEKEDHKFTESVEVKVTVFVIFISIAATVLYFIVVHLIQLVSILMRLM